MRFFQSVPDFRNNKNSDFFIKLFSFFENGFSPFWKYGTLMKTSVDLNYDIINHSKSKSSMLKKSAYEKRAYQGVYYCTKSISVAFITL